MFVNLAELTNSKLNAVSTTVEFFLPCAERAQANSETESAAQDFAATDGQEVDTGDTAR